MAADIGKIFENEFSKVLKLLKETHLVASHKLTDTGSAGNVVSAQPSDYLMGLPPGSKVPLNDQRLFFVEVKASEKHATLGKAMMRPAQRGAIAQYRYLLDLPYLVFFWDAVGGRIQLWDGVAIMGEKNISKKHMLVEWADVGSYRLRTEFVAQQITDHFLIPLASDTLAKIQQLP